MIGQPLHAVRTLIVEDDFWQATDCRDHLTRAGAEVVAMVGAMPAALASIHSEAIDVGLLDINLGGLQSFTAARALIERGVPVLFLTGYEASALPADLAAVPVITKPAAWEYVIAQLAAMLGSPLGATAK